MEKCRPCNGACSKSKPAMSGEMAERRMMRHWNKWMIGLIVLVIGLGMYLNRKHGSAPTQPVDPGGAAAQITDRSPVHVQRPVEALAATEPLGKSNVPRLPREKVEEYLARRHRDVASLLAAFHALQDTNYLREAATNFPNDPQVQWTILAQDAFPQDRRKWLDAFKTSSP